MTRAVTTIIAQLSDPHIRVGADDTGSADALSAAVAAVLALDPLPDAMLVTGDLADGATAAEYERVDELLEPLPMPVHALPGNHDDLDWDGPYATDVGDLRLVLCDTTRPGRDDGSLDLDWLDETLGGCSVATCPSTNLQAKLEIGTLGFTIVPEPPAFLVHTVDVAHVQPVT